MIDDERKRVERLRMMVSHGESVNIQCYRGRTALHAQVKTMRAMIENGDMYQVLYDSIYGVTRYLLEEGADPLLEDREGVSAYQLALESQESQESQERHPLLERMVALLETPLSYHIM
jgi:hypothetical protein